MTRTRRRTKLITPALAAGWALALAACAASGPTEDAYPTYPENPDRSPALDIQVIKAPTRLQLTNTTARSFGASRLWLNTRFSRSIDGLAPGESLDLPLTSFRDEFGDAIRQGGFFATEKPEKLVLAELESGGTFYRLVVVESSEY